MSRLNARSGGREARAAMVAADTLPDGPGALLLVGDPTAVLGEALTARGWTVHRWRRFARGDALGSPWPQGGPYDAAAIRLPKAKAALAMALHGAASVVRPGGRLWLYGANDEGIKSAHKPMQALLPAATVLTARGHCRVYEAPRPEQLAALRPRLDDWWQPVPCPAPGVERPWWTLPGLFARGRLDPGTALLLDAVPTPNEGSRVLDFACGAGVIGAALAARASNLELHLCDADACAVVAARRNLPEAEVFASDGWTQVPPGRYRTIVSNPPIHAGKGEDFEVLTGLIARAGWRLSRGGSLWIVVQRQVPVRRLLTEAFRHVQVHAESGRFQVVEGRRS